MKRYFSSIELHHDQRSSYNRAIEFLFEESTMPICPINCFYHFATTKCKMSSIYKVKHVLSIILVDYEILDIQKSLLKCNPSILFDDFL